MSKKPNKNKSEPVKDNPNPPALTSIDDVRTTGIRSLMNQRKALADLEVEIAARKKMLNSMLMEAMQKAGVDIGVQAPGIGTARMVSQVRSTLNKDRLKQNLLKTGMLASKITKLIQDSSTESKSSFLQFTAEKERKD